MRAFHFLPAALVALAIAAGTGPLAASDQASSAVVVTAQFNSRTSLTLSTRVLQFDVADAAGGADAVVDFAAGVRTAAGNEVVLSVEPARALSGPGGAADVETALSFTGAGDAASGGTIAPDAPATAGRWMGSGRRSGRLTFHLRAAVPGRYTVPLRFVVSTP